MAPGDFFHPISGPDNRNFLASLEFSIEITCPNHCMRVRSTIWSNLPDCFGTPSIWHQTSLLLNHCFQENWPIERRHLWLNSWRRCTSSQLNAHVSNPCRRVRQTVALYTLPSAVREMSLQHQRGTSLRKQLGLLRFWQNSLLQYFRPFEQH